MTVSELIARIKKCPGDAEVYMNGVCSECNLNDVRLGYDEDITYHKTYGVVLYSGEYTGVFKIGNRLDVK